MYFILFAICAIFLFIVALVPEKLMLPFAQADNANWRVLYTRRIAGIGALLLAILAVISII